MLAAVLRGLLSLAFGLVLFIRLDRNILMKGFEIFDKGSFSADFLSMIMEHMHIALSIIFIFVTQIWLSL